ncbi:MAG TPA: magnesium transporter CorA family protein [Anaeromyxobacteraceae bacterium]|nr:magnesium transporter CorA family protein [Anaeromyxobacteraceae bacterium]
MLRAVRLESDKATAGGREVCGPGADHLWVDLSPEPENLVWLGERFGFHPLALEDCANENQRTKFEEYPDTVFMVLHRLAPSPDETDVQVRELHVFLAHDLLVTVHSAPIVEIDRIFERTCGAPGALVRGPDYVLYVICDAITDVHFAIADALADDIDELLAEVMTVSTRDEEDLLGRILQARRTHATLRRRLAPQRELYAALARQGETRVRPQNLPYFRDVLDHLLRLTEEIDTGRDMLGSAMDVHLSMANNRMSGTTARLTLVATIFLPLNFIAGFFGMNLEILHPHIAIPIVLTSMIALPAGLWYLFKRRRLI